MDIRLTNYWVGIVAFHVSNLRDSFVDIICRYAIDSNEYALGLLTGE